MDQSHGSPYDRGSADAYYRRPRDPHWWPQGTGVGTRVQESDMTPEQLAQYEQGYLEQLASGDFKEYD